MTEDKKHADIFIKYLQDSSDRIINAAVIALGKSKSPKAYAMLIKLKDKPSWKNQSLISTLNGLKELGNPKGSALAIEALADLYAPRWSLDTHIWDFRLSAAETLAALVQTDKAYHMLIDRFKQSLESKDHNVTFNNLLLITTLGNPKGIKAFEWLKEIYQDEEAMLELITSYKIPFLEALTPK